MICTDWTFGCSIARNASFVAAVVERHPELTVVVVASPEHHGDAQQLMQIDPVRVHVLPVTMDLLDVAAALARPGPA